MATIQELEQALIKADKSGDVESAKILASEIRRMMAGQAVPPEPQRLRSLAQGATLGFADELEAAGRSLFPGQTYEGALTDIRGKLKAYKEDSPLSALGYEALGGIVPGLAAAPFTGGASVAPTLGRMALIGATEGGIYGFGTGEGGFAQRAAGVPGGAVGGAIAAPVAGVIGKGIGAGLNKLADIVRRGTGGRGSTVVENEIQRLVRQTGKSADEIANDIMDGRILAEDPTIRAAVRGYRASGGPASTILEQSLSTRPPVARERAMNVLRSGLSDFETPSALRAQRASEAATRQAEKEAYDQFQNMTATPEITSAFVDALRRSPGAADELLVKFRAETGSNPFFTIGKDGAVKLNRTPTIGEAEALRRAIGNQASSYYKAKQGGAGEALSNVEMVLRNTLDLQVPDLRSARLAASGIRSARDAFEEGRKAFAGDVNERLMKFQDIMADPELVRSYRAGLMSAIEARSATGSRQSMIRNFANGETKEGRLLREVFPQDQLDAVLRRLETASGSESASQFILRGSPTAETGEEIGRRGLGVSFSDATGALSGDVSSLARVASNIASKLTRDLSDAERARVARILVSEDPNLVRRAILDESAMAALQKRIQELSVLGTRASTGSGAVVGANAGAPIGRGLVVDVFPGMRPPQPGLLGGQ